MSQILRDPTGYYDHIRRYSTAVILASVFGQRGARFDSPKVQALYHAQDRFTTILEPGATPPVDAFPFLKKLPEFLCSWKKEAKAIRQEQRSLYFALLDETKQQMERKSVDCFMARMIKEQEKSGFDDEHLAYLGGILVCGIEVPPELLLTQNQMEAGSDTTASTLLSFILALTKHPEVLMKAQEEIDLLCGTERSPTIEDFGKLPYLTACMTEVRTLSLRLMKCPDNSYVDATMAPCGSWWHSSCSEPGRHIPRICLTQGHNALRKRMGHPPR